MKTVLIIVTAVAVSVAASVGAVTWMERAKEKERQAEVAAAESEAATAAIQTQLRECEAVIAAADTGDRSRAEREFGRHADDAIETCRAIVDLEELIAR